MMFLHGSLCLQLQLDVASSFPPCIGPSRTSKIVKTSSTYLLRCVCACVVDIMHVHESMQLIIHGVELLDIGSTGHNEV
jgi:hypothetical protein